MPAPTPRSCRLEVERRRNAENLSSTPHDEPHLGLGQVDGFALTRLGIEQDLRLRRAVDLLARRPQELERSLLHLRAARKRVENDVDCLVLGVVDDRNQALDQALVDLDLLGRELVLTLAQDQPGFSCQCVAACAYLCHLLPSANNCGWISVAQASYYI